MDQLTETIAAAVRAELQPSSDPDPEVEKEIERNVVDITGGAKNDVIPSSGNSF